MQIRRMLRIGVLGLGTTAACLPAFAADAPAIPPAGTIRHDADTLKWTDAPPSMPPGTQVVVLEGDPQSAGLFTLRVKVPAGAKVPPHWHPRDERVTVLSGRIGVGFGKRFDEEQLRYFAAGGYYVNPTPASHFLFFPVETVVQITGEGPWVVNVLQPEAAD